MQELTARQEKFQMHHMQNKSKSSWPDSMSVSWIAQWEEGWRSVHNWGIRRGVGWRGEELVGLSAREAGEGGGFEALEKVCSSLCQIFSTANGSSNKALKCSEQWWHRAWTGQLIMSDKQRIEGPLREFDTFFVDCKKLSMGTASSRFSRTAAAVTCLASFLLLPCICMHSGPRQASEYHFKPVLSISGQIDAVTVNKLSEHAIYQVLRHARLQQSLVVHSWALRSGVANVQHAALLTFWSVNNDINQSLRNIDHRGIPDPRQ